MLLDVRWINPNGGDWSTGSNWDAGHPPGPGDNAVIDLPRVTVSVSNASVMTLNLAATTSSLSVTNGNLMVASGMTINGTLRLGDGGGSTFGRVTFGGSQIISGGGIILLNYGGLGANSGTITFAPTLTIHGNQGGIGGPSDSATYVYNGSLAADGGGTIILAHWKNNGTFSASNGGTLELEDGTWSSSHPLSVQDGSTASFYRGITTIGSGDRLTLSGPGAFRLDFGTIKGGPVDEILGAELAVTGFNSNGSLDDVTLNGNLVVKGVATYGLFVKNDLTLNGTIFLGDKQLWGAVTFLTNGTLGGNGDILFGDHQGNIVGVNPNTQVTFGPNITIHGKYGSVFGYSHSLLNLQGTIVADVAEGIVNVSANLNDGTIQVLNGATVNLGDGTWSGAQAVTNNGGRLIVLGGPLATFLSILSNPLTLTGGMTVNGHLLVGDAAGTNSGEVVFNGSQTLDGNGEVLFGGSTGNSTTLGSAGSTVTLGPNLNVHGQNGSLLNPTTGTGYEILGTLAADVTGGTINLEGTWTNNGTVKAQNGGTLSTGTPTNYDSLHGILRSGTWQVFANSTLRVAMMSFGIATDAADILLDGVNSNFYADAGTSDALFFFTTIESSSRFTIQNGRNLIAAAGPFTNQGTLTVGQGSQFTVFVSLTNFTGFSLVDGTYIVQGTFQFPRANIFTNAATIILDGPASRIIDELNDDALQRLDTNQGSFTITNARDFTTQGDFTNSGTLVVGPGSHFYVSGTFTDTSTGLWTITGTVTLLGGGSISAAVNNAGSLILAPNTTFTISGGYLQSGSLTIPAGARFVLTGTFTNFANRTLTGGMFNLGGIFQFPNADIMTNAATLVLDGPDAQIIDPDGNNALANFGNNTATGSFTLQHGANFTTAANFSNAGNLAIGAGSTLTAGTYLQTAGTTVLGGGTLGGGVLIDLEGGTLTGSGTINGSVQNAAEIDVGGVGTAGLLTINGDYTQTAIGVLSIDIGGYNPGTDFDQLAITGNATLDGTLNVSLINPFMPRSGETFQILTFASLSGTFATVNADPSFLPPTYDPMDVTMPAM